MNNNRKVSVILPTYNGEKYLRQAIDSMINQTFNDFELIIINDGSRDSTETIIKSYTDKRILYIKNKKNIGLIRSLNIGIKHSHGNYIARMDQDDISLPFRLEKQVNFLDKFPNIVEVGTWAEIINQDGKISGKRETVYSPLAVKYELIFGNIIMHPSVMIRRSALLDVDGYDISALNVEDYDMHLKLLRKGQIEIIPEFLIQYRQHEESITKKSSSQEIMHLNSNKLVLKNISRLIPLSKKNNDIIVKIIIKKITRKTSV